MKLRETVVQRLAGSPGEKLKARELAEWVMEKRPDACAEKARKSGFSTPAQLRNQIVAEIGSNRPAWMRKHPELQTTAERPRRYYWTDRSDEQIVEEAEKNALLPIATDGQSLPSEHDLYPLVARFLSSEFNAYSMRIDEKTASNRKGPNANKWLFPDICGMESLIEGMDSEVLSLVELTGAGKAYLYSLEIKVVLNTSNVRESFFQAVSNSSWANLGYLVATQIDDRVMEELRMLHGLHGIGVVRLDAEDPPESQTLIPARFNEQVDWETFNRLTVENSDFREFAMCVKRFHQTNSAANSGWRKFKQG